jgi:periplasmic protein TonB
MAPMGLLPQRKVVPLRRRARHARHTPWSSAVAQLDARLADLERRMAAFDRRMAALGRHARIQVALALSVAIHAIVIFGVTFKMPDASKLTNYEQPLEVTLVNAKTVARPPKADALAQANLDGGGNTDTPRRAKSPLPVPREARRATEVTMAQKRVEQLEKEARQLMTQAKSRTVVETAPEQPQPKAEPQVGPTAAEILSSSMEIARLEAQISKEWDAYQKRPRRRFIGARTQEYRFARYIEDWRIKIERIGELNYPQAARDQRIYGSLVVTVAIRADGSLEKAEINRPSGVKILDQAAIRIVNLGAPFAPFPADIAKDTDILHITRTWLFTRSDQFLAE